MCRMRSYSKSVWSTDDEATKLTFLQVKDVRSATQNCSFFKYGAGTQGARPNIPSSCDESRWKKVESIGRTKRQTFRPGYSRTSCVKTCSSPPSCSMRSSWELILLPKTWNFSNKNLWHCQANSACKNCANLTLTSEIWFHLWNFRYSFQEMPKVETDGFHDIKNLETQHLWAKNSSAKAGKFLGRKIRVLYLRLNKKNIMPSLARLSIVSLLFRCISPHLCQPWVFVRPPRWASRCYPASLRQALVAKQHLPQR